MHDTRVRKVDIGLILNILIIVGMAWAFMKYPSRWDQAAIDIEAMKPRVMEAEKQVAVMNAQVTTELINIRGELRSINRKLGR